MSIYVHVKHYLTDEGIAFFDGWFARVRQYMSQKPGFIDLICHIVSDNQASGTVYIKLTFNSESELLDWVNEPVHDALVNELDPFRRKPYWHACRTEDAQLDWQSANYETIDAGGAND